jgi:hypothetical protein
MLVATRERSYWKGTARPGRNARSRKVLQQQALRKVRGWTLPTGHSTLSRTPDVEDKQTTTYVPGPSSYQFPPAARRSWRTGGSEGATLKGTLVKGTLGDAPKKLNYLPFNHDMAKKMMELHMGNRYNIYDIQRSDLVEKILVSLPDDLVKRMKTVIPARKRSQVVKDLLEQEINRREEALFQCALAVEKDEALSQELAAWDVTAGDGIESEAW